MLLLGQLPPSTLHHGISYPWLHLIAPFSKDKSVRLEDFTEHEVTKTVNTRKLKSLHISYIHGFLSLAPGSLSNVD